MSCSTCKLCLRGVDTFAVGARVMAERMIRCLPREASSPVAVQLSAPLRTDAVNKKAVTILVKQ